MKRAAQLTKNAAKKSVPIFDISLGLGCLGVVIWTLLH